MVAIIGYITYPKRTFWFIRGISPWQEATFTEIA